MIVPVVFNSLRRFRAGVYGASGARRDALFELLDAATVAGLVPSLAHLSLAAVHRRGGAACTTPWRSGRWIRRRCGRWWGGGPWTGSRSMRWTPASGRATTPRPVRGGATTLRP